MTQVPNRVIATIISVLVLSGCDKGPLATPTTPTQSQSPGPTPPRTLTGLLLSPLPSFVVVGSSVSLTASARYSDGSIQPVLAQWSISPSTAANVSTNGLLTAHSAANATVTARFEGLEARATLFVVDDYSGTWRGTWRRLECFGPRCRLGDRANPVVDLLVTQRNGRELSAVMLFGPWDATRYALAGRGSVGIGGTASISVFLLERGPNGERLLEISSASSVVTVSAVPTLNARMSMRFTEGDEITRLELTLDNLALVSRTLRRPE